MSIIHQYVETFTNNIVNVGDKEAYYIDGSYYFIFRTNESEYVHIEQGWFADYLIDKDYLRIAKPIPNKLGELVTEENGYNYVVLHTMKYPYEVADVPTRLAMFHLAGRDYPYMPAYNSAYGDWKMLWENKIALYEAYYKEQMKMRPVSRYQRLLIDTFPYVIGLTENAIQYIKESNQENRFAMSDQGCVTFQRYRNQLDQPFIFANQFIYDHPMRDVAECIRPLFKEKEGNQKARQFLRQYEKTNPLTIFSWRLLYARLIFPVQLFDFFDQVMEATDHEVAYHKYQDLLDEQVQYEANLRSFFQDNLIDPIRNQIHELDW